MRQRPAGVRRVRIGVADAPGNAAVQRLVVELHRRVLARQRRVVIDADRHAAVGRVAIAVRHLVGDGELLVLLARLRVRMEDRVVLLDRVIAARCIRQRHRHDRNAGPVLHLVDRQRPAVGAQVLRECAFRRRLLCVIARQPRARQQRRAGAVRTIAVRQRRHRRRVRRVRIDVAAAARIGRRIGVGRRLVVQHNRRVLAHQRRVVVNADRHAAVGRVAVAVRHLVGDGELLVLLARLRVRMEDRVVLLDRVIAARCIRQRHRHDRNAGPVLHLVDRQRPAVGAQVLRECAFRRRLLCVIARQPRARQQRRAGAVRTIAVRQRRHRRRVRRVRIDVAAAARIGRRIGVGRRLVVQHNRRVLARQRRVVVDADLKRPGCGGAVLVGHRVADRERHVVLVVARRMVDRIQLRHRVAAVCRVRQLHLDHVNRGSALDLADRHCFAVGAHRLEERTLRRRRVRQPRPRQ